MSENMYIEIAYVWICVCPPLQPPFLADEMTHSARRIITLIVDAIIHCVDLFDWFPENIKCIITYVGVSQKMGCSCRVKMTLKFVAEKLHPFYTKSGLFVDWKWFHPNPF